MTIYIYQSIIKLMRIGRREAITKKLIASLIVLVALTFGLQFKAEAAASISPSSQSIYGQDQYAYWNFSWSGTGPFVVYFRPDPSQSIKTINSRTLQSSMSYSHQYRSSSTYVKYSPQLLVEDSGGHLHVASATVHKYLTRP